MRESMMKKSSNLKVLPPFKSSIPKSTFNVYVGMCAHRGISPRVISKIRILQACPDPKIHFELMDGDALIDRSRGRVATDFLKRGVDDILLFIDDDIVFDPQDIRKLLVTCRTMDLDILGATYPLKTENKPSLTFRALTNNEVIPFGKNGGLYEVRQIATGCMAVQRRVFRKMVDIGMVQLCGDAHLKFYPFFMPGQKQIEGKWKYLSEDWNFCERSRDIGFKVWLDTTIKLGHIGPKVYDWDDILREPKQVHEDFNYELRVLE